MKEKILNRLSELIETNQLNNADLVQIIEHVGGYLNLETISDYAKKNNLSYNGVKKCRKIIKLFNVKFVIDNQ
jgi:uncharacterized protein YehS (DUF1456 family)